MTQRLDRIEATSRSWAARYASWRTGLAPWKPAWPWWEPCGRPAPPDARASLIPGTARGGTHSALLTDTLHLRCYAYRSGAVWGGDHAWPSTSPPLAIPWRRSSVARHLQRDTPEEVEALPIADRRASSQAPFSLVRSDEAGAQDVAEPLPAATRTGFLIFLIVATFSS